MFNLCITDRIVLPERLFIVAGDRDNIEQYNLYYRNAVIDLAPDEFTNIVCAHGKQFKDFWRLEPGNDKDEFYAAARGEFPLTLQIYDRHFELLQEKTTRIVIVGKAKCARRSMLCIGDSITRNGHFVAHVQSMLPPIRTIGSRIYAGESVYREGRGGWTAEMHLSQAARPLEGDSPFLFPAGIPGPRYRGNTSFWSHVVHREPQGYWYNGFQQAAKPNGDASRPFLFDERGYPREPRAGDVVCDPAREVDPLLTWDGARWQRLDPQPPWEFDFAKYLERYSLPKPDIVTLLLGANEISPLERMEDGIGPFLQHMQQMMDLIRLHAADVQFIVNLPIGCAGQDAWGRHCGSNRHAERHRRNIQRVGQEMLKKWDHEEARRQGVHICPMLLVVDPEYGFDRLGEPANKYVATTVERYCDWVHPNLSGHCQMGDALAGTILSLDHDGTEAAK